ncbi:MAG: hypothetical protein QXR45_15540 [Candidatus Bathyarchaeia archaeon]
MLLLYLKYWYQIDENDYFVLNGTKFYRINGFRIKAGKGYMRHFRWESVNMNGLTEKELEEIYRIKRFKELPEIKQEMGGFSVQFKDKPKIFVKNNQIYVPLDNRKLMRNQLEKVFRAFQLAGRVNNSKITTYQIRRNHDLWDNSTVKL